MKRIFGRKRLTRADKIRKGALKPTGKGESGARMLEGKGALKPTGKGESGARMLEGYEQEREV